MQKANVATNGSHGFLVAWPDGLNKCRACGAQVNSLAQYREHVLDKHESILEDCGCCGALHFPDFHGDCRENWERF